MNEEQGMSTATKEQQTINHESQQQHHKQLPARIFFNFSAKK
jgi:hypothetical protein